MEYDMRISDWSSDVCSSDLPPSSAHGGWLASATSRQRSGLRISPRQLPPVSSRPPPATCSTSSRYMPCPISMWCSPRARRSEEHTSELQSLMRISYAVFCLKTKTTSDTNRFHHKYKQ